MAFVTYLQEKNHSGDHSPHKARKYSTPGMSTPRVDRLVFGGTRKGNAPHTNSGNQ